MDKEKKVGVIKGKKVRKVRKDEKLNKENTDIVVKKKKSSGKGKKKNIKKTLFTKRNITYFFVLLVDIVLVIYAARKNIVNYASVNNNLILIGNSSKLFFGRNYITLIITLFIWIYFCLLNRLFLQYRYSLKKNLKFYFLSLVGILILNLILFYIFTVRVY